MTTVPQNMPSTHESGATPTVAPSTAPKPDNNNTTKSPSTSNAPQSHSPSTNTPSTDSNSQSQPGTNEAYPEQKHAGAVGYGPNYRAGPTLEEKIEGLKDELKGKITRKPELVQHGKEILSGEERRKKLTGEDEPNPFQSVDEDEKKVNPQNNDLDQGQQPLQHKSPAASQPQNQGQSRPLHAASTGSPSVPSQSQGGINTSHEAGMPPQSSTQPSGQETTGTRPEFAQHGNPRPNPAGMAINQGQGDAAKEQAATVAPQGTREAEQQRQGNVAEFTSRPVDARQ
ncbi:hypothetical protein CVT26_001968 [Gymnopilus dilepis]|uniref:Uncharacterized protein n=1 Tax=Gymnopilus dilepis TaxID=231916 RepID=A0A409VEL3_9AGAR|nr:hypothetical protein CVT26_001968 [Gymnopilus dilepis]